MLNWRDPKNPLAGGAERVTEAYLRGLMERGHEVAWFANAFDGAPEEEEIDGLQVARGGGKFTSWRAARRWVRKQEKFDLIIDQHHGLPWYAPWWGRTRCVAYIHEVLGPIWDSFYPWPVSTFGRWQERWTHWAYRRTHFWTASSFTRDQLKKHGVRQISTIPYGVDTQALEHLDEKPLKEPLRLVAVSRLAPNKRVDHALQAVDSLRGQGVDTRLVIVGSGSEEGMLRALIEQLGLVECVEFTGAIDEEEKNRRLREAHFLVHTSVREGWGLNVIEANAMGTPACVYPVPGLVESTWHDRTGLVTEAESARSLARALHRALEQPDDYQRHRHEALDRARGMHWDRVLPQACDQLEAWARE